jgi:ankyrin repeat protein
MAVEEFLWDPYLQKDRQELKNEGVDVETLLNSIYKKSVNSRFGKTMSLLVEAAGVDVKGIGKGGATALHIACAQGNVQLVAELIKKGVDPKRKDVFGVSPLHVACQFGNPALIQLLVPLSNVNEADGKGNTALHISCRGGNVPLTNYLLSQRANVNAKDREGNTPLLLACRHGNPWIIGSLLQAGALADVADAKGVTPLHYACASGDVRLVQFLQSMGAKANRLDSYGKSPLGLACEWNWPPIVAAMLDAGLDATEVLVAACESGAGQIVKLALARGADPTKLQDDQRQFYESVLAE